MIYIYKNRKKRMVCFMKCVINGIVGLQLIFGFVHAISSITANEAHKIIINAYTKISTLMIMFI